MNGVHVICYHRVLPIVSGDPASVDYYHSRRRILHSLGDFRRQLDEIRRGCEVLDARGFVARRHGSVGGRPAILLTFDDGYADFRDVILPELMARGLPSVLFPTKAPVVSCHVPPADRVYALLAAAASSGRPLPERELESWVSGEAKEAMLRASPREQDEMLARLAVSAGSVRPAAAPVHVDEAWLRSLPADVYLGAHGLFHHEFGSLPPESLKSELTEILSWVASIRPGQSAGVWLAYPNGKADRQDNPGAVTAAVRAAGVDLAFRAGSASADASGDDDLHIPRLFSQNGVDWLAPFLR
jgi:peptidoglycan/xylan/chitin deacetylase (PgdA/CDA1 family)